MSDFNIEFEEDDMQITLDFSGSGIGGTTDYNDLENKPSINNVTLSGNKSASDLGLGTYSKPSGGIPASDIASGVIPAVDATLATTGAAADAKKVGDEISDLKDELSEKSSYADAQNIANGGYLPVGLMPEGTSMNWTSKTTALSPDAPIVNAYKVVNVTLLVGAVGTFNIGLYTVVDTTATITHLKSVNASVTGFVTFNVDWDLDSSKTYYMFAYNDTGAFKFYSNTVQHKYYSFTATWIVVGSTATLTQTNNGLSCIRSTVLVSVDTSQRKYITVAKSGGQYSTIQDAVNNASNGDTIIVFPGVYEEYVKRQNQNANGKGIHIIGVDRNSCIIKWGSGKYDECTIRLYADSSLENLTIIATAEDAGSWYPTWQKGDSSTYASYAVHWDGGASDWGGTTGVIRNCKIYSECSHALGAGAQKGYTLIVENCEIVRNVSDNHYIDSNYDGALGCHSPNSDVDDNGSKFIMRDCTVINKTLTKALQLLKVYDTSPFVAEIKGCTFKDSAGIDNVIKFINCSNAMITDMSHGNSTDECNYRIIHQ